MKLSASLQPHKGESWPAFALRAAGLGFQGVALPFNPAWTDADLLGIRQALDEQQVEVVELTAHCNFLTPSEDEVRRSFDALTRAMEAGALLNCDHVVTHVGSRSPDPRQPLAPHPENWADATWDLLIRRIWALLDGVEDVGVRLCFEPCATTTLNSLDSLAALVADVATVSVRIALDPAAIFNAEAAVRPKEALAEIFATLADAIAIARATDVRLAAGADEPLLERVPLGQGALDYTTYLKLLNALELDTPLIVPPQEDDAAYRRAHDFLATAAQGAR
ncbi:MAG TPA: sugar phosphate isomerase/epimerase family protein [Planctomycetota bacterium]|nr:sugar phosphate isomerase/epimerase family protein [Planctomycetota bacterium]HRR79751.1 sugar phosphate isomerase/epimerase family protein [Planctomycetota bacterium]HRT96304.1 sugar phosphate isomerase/epimerase family protein [Planctomycetota bacterium]